MIKRYIVSLLIIFSFSVNAQNSGSPNKQQFLVQLSNLKDINDRNAYKMFMGLSMSGTCDVNDAERRQLLRFLASVKTATFAGVTECLWQSDSKEIWTQLINHGDPGNYYKEHRIAELFYRRGQEDRYNKLAAELKNPQTLLEKRKAIARVSLESIPQLMLPIFIGLLSDPDPYMRYLGHRELTRVFGPGSAFNLEERNANEALIAAWHVYLEKNINQLPHFRSPQSYLGVMPGIGIGAQVKSEDGAITIVQIIPGMAAETAKLAAGDKILAANGIAASRFDFQDFINYEMLGMPNTFLKLTIKKAATGKIIDMDIMRKLPQQK